MFKVLDNHIGAVVEQLNELDEANDLRILSSTFVGDRHLKVLVYYRAKPEAVAAKSEVVGRNTPKKAPAVKKS